LSCFFYKTMVDEAAASEAEAATATAGATMAGATAMSATWTTAPGNEAVAGKPKAASYGAPTAATAANEAEAETTVVAAANEAEAYGILILKN
jgi:hypothetical protein